jgi:hypothetical protein
MRKMQRAATHKVGEEDSDTPGIFHNWTNYVCCSCFGRIMGPVAARQCPEEIE